jgi:hypothetical protein
LAGSFYMALAYHGAVFPLEALSMQKLFTIAIAITLAGSVACGKSETEKRVEEAAAEMEKAADALAKAGESASKSGEAASEDMAKGMEGFAKAMAGMAGAVGGGDGKMADPVRFQTLQESLPTVPGWEMGKPRGERMTAPVPFSQSLVRYTKGDSRIEVKVVDSGFAPLLIAPGP